MAHAFADSKLLALLMRPTSVALVGASADPTKTSGLPIRFLRKHGYAGKIYPINPRVREIDGIPCFADIASLPEPPDVAMVLLGADRSVQAVESLSKAGVKAAIILASGFAEAGEAGGLRQQALLEAAGTMRILGPNTIGLVNVTDRITLSASGALAIDKFVAGKVSVVSQSGGILGSLLSRAAARGLGLAKLVSTSNEADLDVADFVSFLAEDPDTKVIALYLESVRNPEKFRAAALQAGRAGKPIIALKIGRSEAGARAAASHTGALVGSDRIYDAFFRQCGVIRAQTFGDLLDIPTTLVSQPALTGARVAIVTSTGGAGTLVSDSLGLEGFETPPPDMETVRRLRSLLPNPDIALDHNPIDVTLAGLQTEILSETIRTLSQSPTYDALVVIVGSSGVGRPDLLANAVDTGMPGRNLPVLAYISPYAPAAAARLTELGVPAFSEPESVARALRALLNATKHPPQLSGAPGNAVEIPDGLSGSLDEAAAKNLFQCFGIPKVEEMIVSSPEEAEAAALEIGGDVVLKILSGSIIHKSDVGGVAVAVLAGGVADRIRRMKTDVARAIGLDVTQFLVQQRVLGGIEMIVGLRRDPLGDAVMLGIGGVTAELLKDTALRLLPPGETLSRDEALTMIDELTLSPLLKGYRGRPRADVDALADAIVAFSNMVRQLGPRLIEAEINPLFVLPGKQGVLAADGVAILSDSS
jgi:acyl-CoA synthetase (NDP forming)